MRRAITVALLVGCTLGSAACGEEGSSASPSSTTSKASTNKKGVMPTTDCWVAMEKLYSEYNDTNGDPEPRAYFRTVWGCEDLTDWLAGAKWADIEIDRGTAVSILDSTCKIGPPGMDERAICQEVRILNG